MTTPLLRNHRAKANRATIPLTTKLDKQLVAYVAAAGAAGMGFLTAAQPAEARVIYTKTNITLNNSAAIDFNGDGVTDVNLFIGGGGSNEVFLYATATNGNGIFKYGAPAFFGVPFGPGEQFASIAQLAAFYGGSFGNGSGGPWADKTNRYLGAKFSIAGKPHFGWIRMSVVNETATITGYAYETIPNKNINAGTVGGPSAATSSSNMLRPSGMPATLGLLARGSEAISTWRREE